MASSSTSSHDETMPSGCRKSFEENIASMREGTRLYLSNDFSSAESLFRRGMEDAVAAGPRSNVTTPPPSSSSDSVGTEEDETDDNGGDGYGDSIDLRGAFALQYAIVGLLRGVASMENDQLDECLARLWTADSLASADAEWVGKNVVRGTCHLVAGVVECLRKEPVKGVYHVATSWRWLRTMRTDALEYRGIGAEVVRSAALLALGAFALILSLLPDALVRVASWSTGFEVDRAAGMDMLRTCQAEGGVYAPIAALGWIAFVVDTKAFLGEEQTEGELKKCEEKLRWAAPRFVDSLFFGILEGDLMATRRRLPDALQVLNRCTDLPCLEELKALGAVLCYKKAIYHLAALQREEAAAMFEKAQLTYMVAGRRTLGPSMALAAAHCHNILGDAASSRKMMAELKTYRDLDKSNWVRGDREAFVALAEYEERFRADVDDADGEDKGATAAEDRQKRLRDWSLLRLATGMVVVMRCTLWMDEMQASRFVGELDDAGYESPDDKALAAMCVAQLHAHRNEPRLGLRRCREALDLGESLGDESKRFGTVPMLHYLSAHFHLSEGYAHRAEASLRSSNETTEKDMVLHHYLAFKTSQLGRIVKARLADSYERLEVPAGKTAVIAIELPPPRCEAPTSGKATLEWDWALEAHDVDFGVRFVPPSSSSDGDDRTTETVVRPTTRRDAADGPTEGSFDYPPEEGNSGGGRGGTLELFFSNSHSYFRGKVISYRLSSPADAAVSVQIG